MFQILPVFAASLIGVLPVEVWSGILRLLDPASLLSSVRSHSFFLSICKGDPVLKVLLRKAVDKERELAKLMKTNPSSFVKVTRKTPGGMFKTNVTKTVDSSRLISAYQRVQHVLVPQELVGFDREEPRVKWYSGNGARVKSGFEINAAAGKPIRRTKITKRSNPLRL